MRSDLKPLAPCPTGPPARPRRATHCLRCLRLLGRGRRHLEMTLSRRRGPEMQQLPSRNAAPAAAASSCCSPSGRPRRGAAPSPRSRPPRAGRAAQPAPSPNKKAMRRNLTQLASVPIGQRKPRSRWQQQQQQQQLGLLGLAHLPEALRTWWRQRLLSLQPASVSSPPADRSRRRRLCCCYRPQQIPHLRRQQRPCCLPSKTLRMFEKHWR
mmetsp:Transcript_79663/g.165497  ORF Transcript_79663/g.165497 Transcript_79663/m.165497 type:complete len:211 (-) Transcript_79663:560-1192(-)